MAAGETEAVRLHAKDAGASAAPLEAAIGRSPERVRVVHMGAEYLGAFVLSELQGGVEEVSGLALTDEGLKTGAERAVLSYVLHAARFARKRAVEVVAPVGSPEARHLEQEGFRPVGEASSGSRRYRVEVKP
jgi:hypothetical protein